VTVLVTAPSLTSNTVHASQAATAPVRHVDLSRIRIDNFGQVNSHYYRGEQPEGRDYADLAALGIKTIIDLRDDYEPNGKMLTETAGMKYVLIPMTTHVPPTPGQLAQFLQIVNDPAKQPVYVHCKGGRHRTGVMTAIYRIEQDRWTPDQAFQEMKQYRFGADFLHPEFKQFVYGYQPGRMLASKGAPSATTTTD
jgi:protein tyrosine/serine phosphatase